MIAEVSFLTLAAARLAAPEVFDTAVRLGLQEGAEKIGSTAALRALNSRYSPPEGALKAA